MVVVVCVVADLSLAAAADPLQYRAVAPTLRVLARLDLACRRRQQALSGLAHVGQASRRLDRAGEQRHVLGLQHSAIGVKTRPSECIRASRRVFTSKQSAPTPPPVTNRS